MNLFCIKQLLQFSHQLNFNQIKFDAFGLFDIDATIIYTVSLLGNVHSVRE